MNKKLQIINKIQGELVLSKLIIMKSLMISKSLSLLFILLTCMACDSQTTPPNIILVMTDDQGYGDISAHGSPDVLTPNMDELKSQGISLEDFQVSPTCAPTRSALMTGRHPFKNGVTHTILERERMALGIKTLPEVLKGGGYTSGIFGKWHLGDEPEYQPDSRGFDEVFIHGGGGIGQAYVGSCADAPGNKYFDPTIKHNGIFEKTSGYCTDIFFTQALSWIKQKADEKKPFFAYITTNAAHSPFIAPDKYKAKFIKQGYPKNAQGFYGMIENIDDNLGLLMEKLNTWDIGDNTILIFMSDNGKTKQGGENTVHGDTYNAGMRGMKGSVHEGGTRVPFFIRWPNHFTAGEKVDALLNHYDILPTLAEIAGIDISDIPDMDGQSFLPYLKNPAHKTDDRYRFVHGGRWPLNPENTNKQEGSEHWWMGNLENSNPENSIYKNCAVRNERYRFVNNKELYDVIIDPGEKQDIAAEHPEVVVEMRKVYDQWWSTVRPFMVNENVPLANEKPFWIEYEKQKELGGIKEWIRPSFD
jgi:arylsulfatase